jgi:hypothetical protein
MSKTHGSGEPRSLRGAIDRPALLAIRDVFNDEEPLATATVDEFLDPTAPEVRFDDGLCGADSCRLDIQWTVQDDYKFHYTDTLNGTLRWGKHPHSGDYIHVTGLEHYHPPPDASSDPNEVTDSCIRQPPDLLVARAVLKLWRTAYHAESLKPLNLGKNPP